MGNIFTLEEATLKIVRDALDDLITEFGKNCRLVYPPKSIDCQNCSIALVGSLQVNRWKTGGPSPFPNGAPCPICNGRGKIEQEVSEILELLCTYEPKGFLRPVEGVNIRLKNATLRTKCFLTDAPKLKRCDHIIYQVDTEGIVRNKFRLASDPVDVSSIVKGRYAVAYWEQIS